MRYPGGQPVRVSATVRDVTGVLVNAGTLTLVVKLAQADGALVTTGTYASPVDDSTGLYHADIPAGGLAAAGRPQAGPRRKLGSPGSQGRTAPAAHSRPGWVPP